MKIVSFDVSSTCIGWAVLESKPKIAYIASGTYKPDKSISLFDSLEKVKLWVIQLLKTYQPEEVAIEDIIQYMPKRSSANTIITLALYNRIVGLTSFEELGKEPYLHTVLAIRHKIKTGKKFPEKEAIPKIVEKHLKIKLKVSYKKTGTIRPELYDEADAIAVGLCHLMKK